MNHLPLAGRPLDVAPSLWQIVHTVVEAPEIGGFSFCLDKDAKDGVLAPPKWRVPLYWTDAPLGAIEAIEDLVLAFRFHPKYKKRSSSPYFFAQRHNVFLLVWMA